MDELLNKAAEAIGMPPTLAERSAQARAEKEGTTVEAVLREWAGEDAGSGSEAIDDVADDSEPTSEAAPEPAPSADDAGAPTEVTTEYLVALAAEAKRMPPKLVRSSAEARARNSKSNLNDVLAMWAGVDLADLEAKAEAGQAIPSVEPAAETSASAATPNPPVEPAPAPAVEPEPADATPAAAPAAAAAAAITMDELLEKVAEAKGMPVPLARRSAEARSKKTGEPVEAVLAEWAGIDPATVTDGDAAQADAPAREEPPAIPAAPAARTLRRAHCRDRPSGSDRRRTSSA